MAFLRPTALWALPLVLIPLVIHLIHRRRFQTVEWAAMTFLLAASSSDLGRRKLNRRLLLLVRMLAIAAIVIAMARPVRLQGIGLFDWLLRPFASSSTMVVLLDRSPSMNRAVGSSSILGTATERLDRLRSHLNPTNTVVFDSVQLDPTILAAGQTISELPASALVDSATNIPALLNRAADWLRAQDVRDAEIFLCSDLQRSDWLVDSAQWSTLRDELQTVTRDRLFQWRFHVTSFGGNLSRNDWIRAKQIASARRGESARVLVEVGSNRTDSHTTTVSLALDGMIDEFEVEVSEGSGTLERLIEFPSSAADASAKAFPLTIAIPPDGNPMDNQFHLLINADRPSIGLVADGDGDALAAAVEVIGRLAWMTDQTSTKQFGDATLTGIIWQGQLPTGDDAARLSQFVQDGGCAMLLPPSGAPTQAEFEGVRWGTWQSGGTVAVADDLTVDVASTCPPMVVGDSLIEGTGADPTSIHQVTLGKGRILFVGIDATSMKSRFVVDGAAMLQLVDNVADASGRVFDNAFNAGRHLAGILGNEQSSITQIKDRLVTTTATHQVAVMTEPGHHAGIFQIGDDGPSRLIAVNRPESEDARSKVETETIAELAGVDWNRLDLAGGGVLSDGQPWLREWWTLAWLSLIALMLAEGWLSLPKELRESRA